jgi:hypothetical protein
MTRGCDVVAMGQGGHRNAPRTEWVAGQRMCHGVWDAYIRAIPMHLDEGGLLNFCPRHHGAHYGEDGRDGLRWREYPLWQCHAALPLDGHCEQLGPAIGQTTSGILRLDVAGGIMRWLSGLTR